MGTHPRRRGLNFKDHFSGHAADYARARPDYPPALFDWLAGQSPGTALAWDAGCGNGQAALALARHFDAVVATDPSATQIAEAVAHERVRYRVEPAEHSSLAPASVDLVCVAQALHWFDLTRFHAEVRRVAARGAVIAAISYALCRVDTAVDAICTELYAHRLAGRWPPERALVEDGYASLAFPYRELAPPRFEMAKTWSLDQYLGYLRTWSASRRHLQATGSDAVAELAPAFADAWGDPSRPRRIVWPLSMRVGRVE